MSDTCSICLEDIFTENFTTKCGHSFHKECIGVWISQQISCPLCRNKDIYVVSISFINISINKHYYIDCSKNSNNGKFYLHNQPPQAWLDSTQFGSLLPLYILKNNKGKKPKFISYYLRQLLLWEDIDKSKIVYNYDDSSKLYICSTQDLLKTKYIIRKGKMCSSSLITRKILNTLVVWLYELLLDIKKICNLDYLLSLNTLILDLTISTIVNNKFNYDTSKYQLILITSVYNCIKFYTKNNIIKDLNLTDEEFKEKLIWYTDNTYVWDQYLSNEISDTINAKVRNVRKC